MGRKKLERITVYREERGYGTNEYDYYIKVPKGRRFVDLNALFPENRIVKSADELVLNSEREPECSNYIRKGDTISITEVINGEEIEKSFKVEKVEEV